MKIIRTTYPLSGCWDTRQGGRPENQDSCGFVDTPHGFLAIMCDGMGGGPAGRQASELAVNTIAEYVNSIPDAIKLDELLQQAIEKAHQTIVEAGQKYPELKGMGTTVAAVLFHKEKAIVAHVGDSRVYQFRFGRRLFRTTDHSMVAELVSVNKLTEEQARLSGQTNLITRALGGGNHLADIDMRPYEKGDRFLLCTDGIWGALPAKDLVERAAKTPSLDVFPVSSVATMHFLRLTSSPSVVEEIRGLGDVPSDMITASHSISNSDPGISTGLLLPDSSGSPSSIRIHVMLFTQPFSSAWISTGLVRRSKMIPSSLA